MTDDSMHPHLRYWMSVYFLFMHMMVKDRELSIPRTLDVCEHHVPGWLIALCLVFLGR